MEELRRKLCEIEATHFKCNIPEKAKQEILSLFSDSIKDIQWEGECKECENGWLEKCGCPFRRVDYLECAKCNGTGKITRPATIEEVLEFSLKAIKLINKQIIYVGTIYTGDINRAITINNGQLRIKED